MRIEIPKFDSQKDLFRHLIDNKKELITQKKSMPITSDIVGFSPALKRAALKAADNGELILEVIANLSNWYDSHQDVMLPGSWANSIAQKGKNIPMIHDHIHSVTSIVAETLDVYAAPVNVSLLGYESDVKSSEALIFKIKPIEKLNPTVYNLYKMGLIKQHSIGLQYVNIELAVNDPDEETEYKAYQKYYPQIINKSDVDKNGYFWAIKEAKIFENSAVLFGSNSMTPVLTTNQPPQGTEGNKQNLFTLSLKP
ncbi:MAG TPA: hypothetical protein VFV37_11050 [Luteibaculaceae bacterium]|nr:hypothetical protein [Luteibaculaceae bacterium]